MTVFEAVAEAVLTVVLFLIIIAFFLAFGWAFWYLILVFLIGLDLSALQVLGITLLFGLVTTALTKVVNGG